jgi:hypothetical protein
MKLQEIIFKRPVKVLQVYCNIIVYGKAKKSFELRKEETRWREMASKSGFVKNDELYLPENILDCPNLKACGLITLEDNNRLQAFASEDFQKINVIASNFEPDLNHCFNLHHPGKLHIFEIKADPILQLFLNYDHYTIGIPERENFKLCALERNEPVEIMINGKTDFSLTSGRERIFKEQFYIFEYLGDFDKCKILKQPFEPVVKSIPPDRKVVNLLKALW